MRYIFQVTIKEGATVEQYVEAWKKGSELIQKHAGARGTRLLKAIGEPNKLIAIAEWDSKQSRDEAMKALSKSDAETQKVWHGHNEFGEISKVGAFDETDWIVLP